jgi:aminoglycoside 2'-N-acetyltransferase I
LTQDVRVVRTQDLDEDELVAIRRLCDSAFEGDFDDDNWGHAIGGTHFLIERSGRPVAHVSVVPRRMTIGDLTLEAGYVEAVATEPSAQGSGLGTAVMRAATEFISERYPLGALDTGENSFYARMGWETWRGPTGVRAGDGWERTPHEDGNVMILRTGTSPELDLDLPIVTDWRPGEVW